jgi:nucleoside-diphosphate-sugar epimerase
MRAFVTGATGLLGNNLVKELRGRGLDVTALVRRRDARRLVGPGVELVVADLRDVGQFETRMSGADVLVHAAACYGEFYRGAAPPLLAETNVAGTTGLLEAAERQGVRTVVYLRSAAVLRAAAGGTADETSPYDEETHERYFASKVAAEKAVLRFSEEHPGMRIVLILPAAMLGPGDVGPTPTGAFVLKLLRGELAFVLPGWQRIVDARDVAFAAAEAIDRGRSGERYVIGGRRYPVAEIYRSVTEVSGRPTPTKPISAAKLLFLSRILSLASRLTRRPPPVTPAMVQRLQEGFSFCSDKAVRELGVRFRPLEATMNDTVKWFQAEQTAGEVGS